MVFYIEKDPSGKTCCTIDAKNVLKLYKATVLPMKLANPDDGTFFFFSKDLERKGMKVERKSTK